ncbi:lipoprotein-anchoring transpeptidase ErfK/SrfK [Ochrobactrum daejeonense]|uniref:Lipoprotein-anchoring transpeptidase ErfK/SrfK n=1 Tax=Brucella daejeonensis TaxID=659015 RepID=A0A7W9B1A3_9HYPH|nr:L,D-transpeptidase [Brucella daejeonensis]MBB5704405.1 lipoprotein-anchoring transpeptidase ErfK/SrfK [Brucella daejeonensis]NKB78335.1 L,D-transpeptidase [Brucella daejeonensis]
MAHSIRMFRFALFASVAATAVHGAARADESHSAPVAERPVQLAQLYDPGEEIYRDRRVRVFIDQYGRRITMDRRGRILSVEEANSYDPNGYDRQAGRARQSDDNWTLDGPVDGGVPYDGFGNVPEDPNYYPAAPTAPQYGGNRDGQVQRSELPPAGDEYPDNTNSANADPGYDDGQNYGRPGYEQPRDVPSGVPNPGDMAPAVEMPKGQGAKARIAAYQVLLDRAGASPGVIDGRSGSNVDKAAAAYGELTGKSINPADEAAVNAELQATGGPAFTEYTITNEDVGRQYVASIPVDYAHKAQLPAMAYTSVTEMLGEKFHTDETYLKEINPGVNFNQPGSVVKVPNLGKPVRAKVARIIADKGRKQVRGYDESGRLVVAYPSTIGSSDNPSPSGVVQVQRIAINPNYTYNPKINFKQGNNDKVLTIPPGPNGPVGTVWIALSKPTYGIHGTPEPSRIGKTSSHGCVRLTNWDAEELAKLVKSGVTVEFTG